MSEVPASAAVPTSPAVVAATAEGFMATRSDWARHTLPLPQLDHIQHRPVSMGAVKFPLVRT